MRIAGDGAIVGSGSSPADTEHGADNLNGSANDRERTDDVDAGGDDGYADWGIPARGDRDDDDAGPLNWASATPSLSEHLRSQLSVTQASPRDRALVEMLIEALDEHGYLSCSLEELLALCPEEAQVEADDLQAALALLQSFDPPGVGARSPADCLRIQLELQLLAADPRDRPVLELARRIVSEHLPLLAARDFVKLRRMLESTDDELRAAHQVIRGLNPHPGVGFGSNSADYVVPDIYVRRKGNRWIAQLNPDVMPRLRVNPAYAAAVKAERNKGDRGEGQATWSTRLQEARWLIRNMQQRFDTILRVSQAIVDRQSNFFTHGAIAMRPLVLREIADTVGLHESTISRVTSNKYMATPFGVFELKYFFGSHVATETGGAASSTAIRALIKQLIGAEDTKNPLSDSRLAELLGEQGIVVARRTVAKYREALRIAPVAMRKSI
jgi:RNA polymerase sigma-54 factor